MIPNPIQFAVVREDPDIETHLMQGLAPNSNALLIASGGCTAFTLVARFPSAELTLVDPNLSQIELIQQKITALNTLEGVERSASFGVGLDSPDVLTACGNFESLFKSLRNFLYEFVLDREQWLEIFTEKRSDQLLDKALRSKYWPVAFQLFFSDPILIAMFGTQAIQHATPGSYPGYFQKVFERGLLDTNARHNYFLHHVFLGHYLDRKESLPAYLTENLPKLPWRINFLNCAAEDIGSFDKFDLLSFSNIFDWMNGPDVEPLARKVGAEAKVGAWLVYRQLNNDNDIRALFGKDFRFDDKLARKLHSKDRSLFYSSLHIARKVGK